VPSRRGLIATGRSGGNIKLAREKTPKKTKPGTEKLDKVTPYQFSEGTDNTIYVRSMLRAVMLTAL
jgi:hypothetical protein